MRPPGPVELFRLLGRARAALEVALGAVPPLLALLNELNALVVEARAFIVASRLTQQQAAQLVSEVETTRGQVQAIIDSARRTEADARHTAADAQQTVASAATAVLEARDLIGDVRSLMERFEPALRKLAPVADSVAEQITVEDAEAFTALVHSAPQLVEKLSNDVVPVLDSLDTVGSDLREVMDTTQQMDEMLGAVPGLGRVKKRIERQQPAARRQVSPSPREPERTPPVESLEPVDPDER